MGIHAGLLAVFLCCAPGPLLQSPQELAGKALPDDTLSKRAVAFAAAIASGDAKRIQAFQPAEWSEQMSAEDRRRFAKACEGLKAFMETPAGRYQRALIEAFPAIEGLAGGTRAVALAQEIELRDPQDPQLVHGLTLRMGFERAAKGQEWVVTELQIEIESMVEGRGIPPKRDLAPASFSAVFGALLEGMAPAKALEVASGGYADGLLGKLEAPKLEEPLVAGLLQRLHTALEKVDLALLLEVVEVPERNGSRAEEERETFKTVLEASPGWPAIVAALPRPRGFQARARRIELVTAGASGATTMRIHVKEGRPWLEALVVESPGEQPRVLRSLLPPY